MFEQEYIQNTIENNQRYFIWKWFSCADLRGCFNPNKKQNFNEIESNSTDSNHDHIHIEPSVSNNYNKCIV